MRDVVLDTALDWRAVAAVADGAGLALSASAKSRVETASRIVQAIVESGVRAYGITTGVGALADTVVDRPSQSRLSHNIVFSHACGIGPLLGAREVRAIIAAQIANFSHGHSGVRPVIIETLQTFLREDCVPDVPSKGSAGYLTHNAHIALVLIGAGSARLKGEALSGREALRRLGLEPVNLQAKEGLSLVNGTACATGLGSIALARTERFLTWADAIAALTIEALDGQMPAFDEPVLGLRRSRGIEKTGRALRERLFDSGLILAARGARTQDALSLRSVPHAHGAGADIFDFASAIVDQELASVTDNPVVSGTPEAPLVSSEAHAVAPALGQVLDSLAISIAQIAAMSERRIDRLVNPLVSGLPAFLATDPGAGSGLMIAQYTSAALAAENRRLGAPASLDGGITSALQEDFLAHPTAAANKLLAVIDNAEQILGIEYIAAAQAHDFKAGPAVRARGTDVLHRLLRSVVPAYGDERPLGPELEKARDLLRAAPPPAGG